MHSKPICLCGFMGVGKTTLGRGFAEKHLLTFKDLDQEIESQAGQTVSEIFNTKGEEQFRKIELECLQSILSKFDIIALGGGTLLTPECLELTLSQTKLVFLKKELQNIDLNLPDRPLLDSDKTPELYQERLKGYSEAPCVLNLDELDQPQIYDNLWQIWRK